MSAVAQQIVLGLLLGGLYGLAAAGLSLVFGVLKVLNVAHGELIMLGGYAAFWLFALAGLDPFASIALVVPGAFALGVVLYAVLFRFVVRAHEETRIKNSLLIGFGLSLALHALAVRLWTADERSITMSYGGEVFTVAGLAIPVVRLASLVLAFALIGALHLLLTRWRWGRAIRATADDWEAALLTGIDIRRAYLLAFALGTALAGAAGTLVAVGYSVSPSIGLEWTLKALIVVVLSYYPQHPFGPHWTFDALLITFIGGVGTLHGPVLGAVFYVFLKEYLALRWVDFHVLIFGTLFVVIVLLLPGGLVEAASRIKRGVTGR